MVDAFEPVDQDAASKVFEYLGAPSLPAGFDSGAGLICGIHSLLWCGFLVWVQSVKLLKSHSEYLSAYTHLRMALLIWTNGTAVFYIFVSGVASDYPRLISCQTTLVGLDLYLSSYLVLFLSMQVVSEQKMRRIKRISLATAAATCCVIAPLMALTKSIYACSAGHKKQGGPASVSYFWLVDVLPDAVRLAFCVYGIATICIRHRSGSAIDTVYSRVSSGPDWEVAPAAPQPLLSSRPRSGRRSSSHSRGYGEDWCLDCFGLCKGARARPKRLRRPGWTLLLLLSLYGLVDGAGALLVMHYDDHCDAPWASHLKQAAQFGFNCLFPWTAWYSIACDREYWEHFTDTLIREAEDTGLSRLPRQAMSKLKRYLLRSDDWVLGEVIGGGFQAQVYLAHLGFHPSKDTTIVAKVWELYDEHSGFGEMADGPKQAIREAALMLQAQHPHVARLRGLTIDPPNISVLMEYCELGSLQSYLAQATDENLAMWQRVQILFQVACAMQAMHKKGIAHRDLKWDNVMLVEDDGAPSAKVIDFGNARLIDRYSSRKYTLHVGSVAFGAPELHDSDGRYGLMVDCYSFGFLVYQTLASSRLDWEPSEGLNRWTRLEPARLADGGPELTIPPSVLVQEPLPTPEPLIGLMCRCWQTAPERRPGFDAIASELWAVLIGFEEVGFKAGKWIGEGLARARPDDRDASEPYSNYTQQSCSMDTVATQSSFGSNL